MAECFPQPATWVFEGTGNGQFEAFRANTGEKIWSASTQSGITAAPSPTRRMANNTSRFSSAGAASCLLQPEKSPDNLRGWNNVPRMLAFKLGEGPACRRRQR